MRILIFATFAALTSASLVYRELPDDYENFIVDNFDDDFPFFYNDYMTFKFRLSYGGKFVNYWYNVRVQTTISYYSCGKGSTWDRGYSNTTISTRKEVCNDRVGPTLGIDYYIPSIVVDYYPPGESSSIRKTIEFKEGTFLGHRNTLVDFDADLKNQRLLITHFTKKSSESNYFMFQRYSREF